MVDRYTWVSNCGNVTDSALNNHISIGIEILCILNVFDTKQVYTSYLDLAPFSRRVSAREPSGQFWDENEKLCWALASILLGSRWPEKHSIESRPIGVDFDQLVTFFKKGPNPPFCSRSFTCKWWFGTLIYIIDVMWVRHLHTWCIK